MTLELLLYVASALVLGLMVGSFLNVVIYRLPISMFSEYKQSCEEFLSEGLKGIQLPEGKFNIAFPRSHCPSCKTQIPFWHNIPVLSYLLLKGQCHACGTSISYRYPTIEFFTGLLSAFVIFELGLGWQGFLILILTWSLVALTWIDIDHQLLPDNIVLPLLWLGLGANIFGVFTDLESAVIGAIACYLVLWTPNFLFKLIRKKDGMGQGDFKLLAALGAWMGWQQLGFIVLTSAFVGAIIGILGIIIQGRDKNVPIPFGPYLAAAGWIAFFWGNTLSEKYLPIAQF